jgi:glutathione synthase/RimK-type ligase-like ATP-grasp enzyme
MRIGTLILGIVVASIGRSSIGTEKEPVIPEPSFYRALSLAAVQLGIDVYVFEAEGYQSEAGLLHAYRLEQNRWVRQLVPLPDIIYDRCFYTSAEQRISSRSMLQAMALRKPNVMLNGILPTKLDVYEALKENSMLAKYLPQTIRFNSAEQLGQLEGRYHAGVILKPAAGMQGRGIAHVKRSPLDQSTQVNGRTLQNRPFSKTFTDNNAKKQWLTRFINRTTYLIQPYLELCGEDDKPFDVRALLQKNGMGRWSLSGVAVRCGQIGSVTSNLHGGGDARPADELLSIKFGTHKAERLLEEIHTISKQTAERLESRFGRFAELGFDFGIEPDGRLWLLEVNSKPGRTSFRKISDLEAERHSIIRPLLYARFLSRRLHPSFVANISANGRIRNSSISSQIRPFNVQEVHR